MAPQPSPREAAVFARAVARARSLGLDFKPGELRVRWFRADPFGNSVHGFVTPDRPPEVWLRLGLGDESLFCVACHEFRHLYDILNRLDFQAMGRAELEERASVFAELAVEVERRRSGGI